MKYLLALLITVIPTLAEAGKTKVTKCTTTVTTWSGTTYTTCTRK
jgi:hypothetical protein